MREILNRKIKEGDLVVVKGTGRYNLGLRMGIVYGKSVRFCGTDYASYNSCALIENPSKAELKHKQSILDSIADVEKVREVKASRKAIGKKDLVVGQMYDGSDVYCGKVRVTVEYYEKARNTKIEEGYGYIDGYRMELLSLDMNNLHHIRTTKTIRKHYETTEGKMLQLPQTLTLEHKETKSNTYLYDWGRRLDWNDEYYVKKVTVEFLDIKGKGGINVNVSN
jgi:hypothetical protein